MKILKLRMVWERLAREDPFWAVLTVKEKRGNRWSPSEFFETGKVDVTMCLEQLSALNFNIEHRNALDFGCGVGRLTQALAGSFTSVTGVDVSMNMIQLARQYNSHGSKIIYQHNPKGDLDIFPNQTFDFLISLITLQHLPRELAIAYLKEFVRICRPGGCVCVQIVTEISSSSKKITYYPPTLLKRLLRWIRKKTGIGASMEMNALPLKVVESVISDAGGEIIFAREHCMSEEIQGKIFFIRC